MGFSVTAVRTLGTRGTTRQAIETRMRVDAGWQVVRTSHAELLERARASYRVAARRRFAPRSRASTSDCSARRARRSRPCSSPTAKT